MIAFLISEPWATLAVIGLAYLASIPYAAFLFRRRERENRIHVLDPGSRPSDEDQDAAE